MGEKKRIEFIDLAKGFCIILVVAHHTCNFHNADMPLPLFFKAFRIPLYFFLSGFFFKTYGGFFDFMRKKTNKLLIPFSFFYLIASVLIPFLLYHFLHYKIYRTVKDDFPSMLFSFFTDEYFYNGPIWFLLCLFEVNILFYLCHIIANNFQKHRLTVLTLSTFLLGLVGLMLAYKKINLPMFLDSSLTALPFFMMGYMVNRHTNILQPNKYDRYWWFIVIACFTVVYILAGDLTYMTNKIVGHSYFSLYINGFLGTIAIMYLAKKIIHIPIVSYWGRYSIIILVVHRIILQLYGFLLKQIGLFDSSYLSISINESTCKSGIKLIKH